jgi:hypothetical protein
MPRSKRPEQTRTKATRSRLRGIHVRLDLEDHAGELVLGRHDDPFQRLLGSRRGSELGQRIEHLLHAEVVDGAPEEDWCLVPRQEFVGREDVGSALEKVDVAARMRVRRAETLAREGIVEPFDDLLAAARTLRARGENANAIGADVEDPAELFSQPHRPCERHGRDPEDALDLVEELQGLAHLAIELVDEGDDRGLAGPGRLPAAGSSAAPRLSRRRSPSAPRPPP